MWPGRRIRRRAKRNRPRGEPDSAPTYTCRMRKLPATLVCACLALGGCSSSPGTVTTAPGTMSPSASPSPSPSPSLPEGIPSATGSPVPDAQLPLRYPIAGKLTDGSAGAVVNELHRVAGGLPVLKLDLTETEATLTALRPDRGVISFVWRDGLISRTDSDIQYLDQATFDPADFPVSSLGRMFSVADMQGVRGELVLQIVEYRAGQVLMTVSSRPESRTLFFRKDGTAVPRLGVTSVADLTAGIDEVVGDSAEVFAVTVSPATGFSADLPDAERGVVLNRTRPPAMPVYETRRTEVASLPLFDPRVIEPASLAKVVARTQEAPDQECTVSVDMSLGRSAPVARVQCGATTSYADMQGRDMTALVG